MGDVQAMGGDLVKQAPEDDRGNLTLRGAEAPSLWAARDDGPQAGRPRFLAHADDDAGSVRWLDRRHRGRGEVRLTERNDREVAGLDQRQHLLRHAEELPTRHPLTDARTHHRLVRDKQLLCVHDAVAGGCDVQRDREVRATFGKYVHRGKRPQIGPAGVELARGLGQSREPLMGMGPPLVEVVLARRGL